MQEKSIYDFSVKSSTGSPVSISQYRGQVLLIVNVASLCGFTPQYEGLQNLYEKFKTQGFTVLAFPCNQFGNQEPGDDASIGAFCDAKFRIQFPVFAKIDVNGANADPLYQFLTHEKRGLLGTAMIKWNFTKFLVDRSGRVIERYAPNTEPKEIAPKIEALLGAKS